MSIEEDASRRFIAHVRQMNPDDVLSRRLDDLERELDGLDPLPVPGPVRWWSRVAAKATSWV